MIPVEQQDKYVYSHVYMTQSGFIVIRIKLCLHSVQNLDKITTTLVSYKSTQPCIGSITNYKSCIHCFPLFWALDRVHISCTDYTVVFVFVIWIESESTHFMMWVRIRIRIQIGIRITTVYTTHQSGFNLDSIQVGVSCKWDLYVHVRVYVCLSVCM